MNGSYGVRPGAKTEQQDDKRRRLALRERNTTSRNGASLRASLRRSPLKPLHEPPHVRFHLNLIEFKRRPFVRILVANRRQMLPHHAGPLGVVVRHKLSQQVVNRMLRNTVCQDVSNTSAVSFHDIRFARAARNQLQDFVRGLLPS